MAVKGDKSKLDTSEPVKIQAYCPDDISKITSQKVALSRPFHVAELNQPEKIHVHLRAYVDFYGGYAEHGRRVLFGLADSGKCVVKLTPIKSFIDTDPLTMQKCGWFIKNPAFKIDKSIFVCVGGPGWMQEKYLPKERYSVAWTMIESLSCNQEMKEWLSNVNEVWAPTDCDYDRFKNLGIENIHKIHLGYDPLQYNVDVPKMDISVLNGRYVFGVLGSWNKRKGIKKIVRAFCSAFDSTDNVSLMLVCKYGTRPYDGFKDNEWVTKDQEEVWDIVHDFNSYTKDFKHSLPHVVLIDRPVHETVLPTIVQNFNCGVGFSMGESTWLPGLEMMAMGKPVIQLASQCSGFMEYMNDANSYLCKNVKYVDADQELFLGTSDYYKGQQFAEGDEEELASMMKHVYETRNSDKQEQKIARALQMVKNWTWKQSIDSMVNRLEDINNMRIIK